MVDVYDIVSWWLGVVLIASFFAVLGVASWAFVYHVVRGIKQIYLYLYPKFPSGYWRQIRAPETDRDLEIVFIGREVEGAGEQYEKPRIKRINDHVYELLGAREINKPPLVDIVLFHGPTRDEDWEEAYWQNWMTSDGHFFPQLLLEDFPNCRIHSVSYDARVILKETDSQLEYYNLVENLETDIIITPKIGQTCPVVLVGHSIGGNVINNFILGLFRSPRREKHKYKTFLQNLRGIYYFSTPQLGMDIRALVAGMGLPDHRTSIGPLYESLERLNKVLARMTTEMKAWYDHSGTIVHVAYVWEGRLAPFTPDSTCSCGVSYGIIRNIYLPKSVQQLLIILVFSVLTEVGDYFATKYKFHRNASNHYFSFSSDAEVSVCYLQPKEKLPGSSGRVCKELICVGPQFPDC
ncbi:hypothetical protein R1sor_012246 [Riccia sorocarpa]|uniref:Uncharacterized protein n=1 Tax=Riccia sorocarpa TaxID=122646 RepID=A0ABD3I6U7_9MARC